jgi:cold shock CspA family protein
VICGDDGQEYLLHRLEMADESSFAALRPGVPVRFEVAWGPKGLRAEGVRVAR